MDHYKHLPESPVGGYTLVHGPDGFNAMADSFEDAVTFTCRLDQQLAELAALRAEVERLQREIFQDQDERGRLLAEVERLREERRWIPVEKRLPTNTGTYLIVSVRDGVRLARWTWMGWLNDDDATHWRPLPALPMEEE